MGNVRDLGAQVLYIPLESGLNLAQKNRYAGDGCHAEHSQSCVVPHLGPGRFLLNS